MELAIKLISKDFSARVAFDQSPERREIKKHADNRKKKNPYRGNIKSKSSFVMRNRGDEYNLNNF